MPRKQPKATGEVTTTKMVVKKAPRKKVQKITNPVPNPVAPSNPVEPPVKKRRLPKQAKENPRDAISQKGSSSFADWIWTERFPDN